MTGTLLIGCGMLLLATLLSGAGLITERCVARFGALYRSLLCRAALLALYVSLPVFILGAWFLPASFPRGFEEQALSPPHSPSAPLPFRGGKTVSGQSAPRVEVTSAVNTATPQPGFLAISRPHTPAFLSENTLPTILTGALGGGYVTVAFARLLWLVLAYAGTASLRRRSVAVASHPAVRTSETIPSAVAVGVLHPTILVPTDFFAAFDEDTRRAILAHEQTHLTRKDPLWNLAFRLLEALLWPLPTIGALRRRHEEASEAIADSAALQSGIAPRVYAQCLLALAEASGTSRYPVYLLGVGVSLPSPKPTLSRRVERLLAGNASGGTILPIPLRLRAVITAAAFVGASFFTLITARTFAAGPEDHWASDKRLDQQITISAEGISLAELLPLISQKTGVSLTATRAVSDEKVVFFSGPRSLRETLADLATLFNDAWREETGEKSQPTYRLIVPAKTRNYEEKLARADRDWILSQMDILVRALGETPEQLKQRKADDPIRMAIEGSRLAV